MAEKMICKSCGSTNIHYSHAKGFNGWFWGLWLAVAVCFVLHILALAGFFLILAGLKTFIALFQWGGMCESCKSKDVIPVTSPLGKKLLAERQTKE